MHSIGSGRPVVFMLRYLKTANSSIYSHGVVCTDACASFMCTGFHDFSRCTWIMDHDFKGL